MPFRNIVLVSGGESGPASTISMVIPGLAAIPDYSVVTTDLDGSALLASSQDVNHGDRVLGVKVTVDLTPVVLTFGPVSNPSWNWQTNKVVFLGVNGVVTQDPFTGQVVQALGYAISPTEIFVRVSHGIRRA